MVQTSSASEFVDETYLISDELVSFSKRLAAGDNTLSYYINTEAGNQTVGGGLFGSQTIRSVAIDRDDQNFITNTFNLLNANLGVSFKQVSDIKLADIRIYYDTDIRIDSSNDLTLGLAVSNEQGSRKWNEVFINYPPLANDINHRRYAVIHEIGHALGLEHSFDSSDGDYWRSTNPNRDAYPEDTVMAYRTPRSNQWPTVYSSNDLRALRSIWGPSKNKTSLTYSFNGTQQLGEIVAAILGPTTASQTSLIRKDTVPHTLDVQLSSWSQTIKLGEVIQASDRGLVITGRRITAKDNTPTGSLIAGGSGNDRITANLGWDLIDAGDGDDLVIAGDGRDIITGGNGSDELRGGFGLNVFLSARDGSADSIVIHSDQWLYNPRLRRRGNNAKGQQCDIVTELDASDRITIIGSPTAGLNFAQATAHGQSGIGIFAGSSLEALYTGTALNLDQIRAMTMGDPSLSNRGI